MGRREKINELIGHNLQHQDGDHGQSPPKEQGQQQGPGSRSSLSIW